MADKIAFSDQEYKILRVGLKLYLASLERSVKANEGSIREAFETQLRLVKALDGRF